MKHLPRALRVTGARQHPTTLRKKTPGRAIVGTPGQRHKAGDILNVFEVGALERMAESDRVRVALSWVTGGFRVDSIEYL